MTLDSIIEDPITRLLDRHTDDSLLNLGKVEQVNLAHGLPAIVINHPNCTARLSLYGGHVLNWQPAGEKEVFWLSKTSSYQHGKAIRGGIPLCWPWFGPLAGSNQHGFARQILWQLDDVAVTESGVTIEISWQGQEMDELWPHQVKLKQTIFFGKTFEQSLAITNLSEHTITYTGALHSYFTVSSPDNVTVPLLDNVSFDDKLTGQRVENLTRENCRGPIDTVYYSDVAQKLVDTGFARVIEITNSNTQQWVLWNPGVETAAEMADVHTNGEQEYVCLEAANTQAQAVLAQQTVVMSQQIAIKAL